MTLTETTLRILGPMGGEIYGELVLGPWAKVAIRGVEELATAVGSSPGLKRSRNEDRAVIAEVFSEGGDRYRVAIVCDGVGGSEMGDAAATLATSAFLGRLQNTFGRRPLESLLVELVNYTDDTVSGELHGKGSTTMSVIIATENGDVAAANIGDSRIFSWEPGKKLIQVSTDDTMENEFRNLPIKDPSVLDAKGLRGTLSQAIGDMGQVADRLRVATLSKHLFPAGALLATDGIWKGNDQTFIAIAQNAGNGVDVARRAISVATWSGGLDNASIIAIEDLATFAKSGSSRSSRGGGVRLWINDTKIVIPRLRTVPFAPEPSSAKEKAESRKKGGDDRRRRGRTDLQRKPHSKPDDQLSFIQESGKVSRKPKIEISTEFSGGEQPPT